MDNLDSEANNIKQKELFPNTSGYSDPSSLSLEKEKLMEREEDREEKQKEKEREEIQLMPFSLILKLKKACQFTSILMLIGSVLIVIGILFWVYKSFAQGIGLIITGTMIIIPGSYYAIVLLIMICLRDQKKKKRFLQCLPEFLNEENCNDK